MELIYLKTALTTVNWNSLVSEFITHQAEAEAVANCNMRLAIWSKQLESVDKGNPSLSFIREMQAAGHHVAALIALALYNPAAAAIRTVFETALYYTFFRTHTSELATLVRNEDFFVDKQYIIDYHKLHTVNFVDYQNYFGLIGRLKRWYSQISVIIHGQIPGIWITHQSLADLHHEEANLHAIIKTFKEGEEIVHHLFLCTVGVELWDGFTSTSKRKLLSGLPGSTKTALGLSSA